MKKTIKQQVEKCIEDLNAGNLIEHSLLKIIDLVEDSKTQDILYLQAKNTSLTSEILGMRIIERFDIPKTLIALASSVFLIFKKNQIPDNKIINGNILYSKPGTNNNVSLMGVIILTS